MKDLIILRKKPLAKGGASLYLEHNRNGKREYEFLRLYLRPDTKENKAFNKSVMEAAKVIQSERITALMQGKAKISANRADMNFLEYYNNYIEAHSEEGTGYRKQYATVRNWWIRYIGENTTLEDITPKTIAGFASFLKKTSGRAGKKLAPNSQKLYFDTIVNCLKRAEKEGIIDRSPVNMLNANEKPKNVTAERHYLDMEELKRVSQTPCKRDAIKKAFMFSCFTGLRYSDIIALEWGMIANDTIVMRMQKTKQPITLPLSENAKLWLPEREGVKVFNISPNIGVIERHIAKWMKDAGVNKRITFHCARHTFATLALTYGADLYTVSKLLGHTNIATTQIYAKIVDKKKVEAVNLIPTITK